MKLKIIALLVLTALAAAAQAPAHSVTLTWVDGRNPAGTTYSVHRSAGMCSGTPVFSKIAAALAVKTYEDTSVTPGNYCYTVTATFMGMESANSPTAAAAVPSFPPSELTVVVK
jgi:hypothetical protein